MSDELKTTLDVWRPSEQWTTLFDHEPYAAPLWALLFDPEEFIPASRHYGSQWASIVERRGVEDHAVGYESTVGKGKERLVERLEPLRRFGEAWRVFSLGRVLALALAPIPPEWPLRLDSSQPTRARGPRYAQYLARAVESAARLAAQQPQSEAEAISALMEMMRGAAPQGGLSTSEPPPVTLAALEWPESGAAVREGLLGTARFCPTSHVDAMTRARRQWEASW